MRVMVREDCWSSKDGNGNEILLRKGWEGEVLAVNGERITVKFHNPGKGQFPCKLEKPINVHVRNVHEVNFSEGHHE
jgi:hypothetical protein